ncbi:MAG: hypothetical protein JXB32_01800 [Deltaproteobacteria bacterium]|nr:hypothetical protein [Deltaproteobacteria bacterium]
MIRRVPGILVAAAVFAAGCDSTNDSDPCRGVGCSSHGRCYPASGAPYCFCFGGYHPEGLDCVANDPDDPCLGVDCTGHGSCSVVGDDPECACDPGYHHPDGYALHCFADETDGPLDADADADADALPCGTTTDCVPFEDGDPCNGTLSCVGGRCVIDPATVVRCDASGDGPCGTNRCDPATGLCAMDYLTSSTECRPGDGDCDVAESCSGDSAACPDDAVRPSGYLCRPRENPCDAREFCNGTSPDCPADAPMPNRTICGTDDPEICCANDVVSGCTSWVPADCHVCQDGACVLHDDEFDAECTPTCATIGRLCGESTSCCIATATCSGWWQPSSDCRRCCLGEC